MGIFVLKKRQGDDKNFWRMFEGLECSSIQKQRKNI